MLTAEIKPHLQDQVIRTEASGFRTLEIILKIVERCNLACPYCYYFFKGDKGAFDRPAFIQPTIGKDLVQFVNEGRRQLEFERVRIVFHGGEPMMLPLKRFETLCDELTSGIDRDLPLELAIQTNGTLIDQSWLDALAARHIFIGVSVDGPPEVHDKNRVDVHGRGSYARIAQGFELLRSHPYFGGERPPASICVIDVDHDYSAIAAHLSRELGIKNQSYLLPDCSHDDGLPNGRSAEDYGNALVSLFDFACKNPDVHVREVEALLRRFQTAQYKKRDDERVYRGETQIIVVCSDGSIQIDDTFIPTGVWRSTAPSGKLAETTLGDWLKHDVFSEIRAAYANPPGACSGCEWRNICNGGDLENRFSSAKGFDNPSVFCGGLKRFYTHVVEYLLENGYPAALIDQRLHERIVYGDERLGFAS